MTSITNITPFNNPRCDVRINPPSDQQTTTTSSTTEERVASTVETPFYRLLHVDTGCESPQSSSKDAFNSPDGHADSLTQEDFVPAHEGPTQGVPNNVQANVASHQKIKPVRFTFVVKEEIKEEVKWHQLGRFLVEISPVC